MWGTLAHDRHERNRQTDRCGNQRAVSPVIGVVLMVAITVILAVVVGTFVLGLSEGREPGPRATFSAEVADYTIEPSISDGALITITHEGGDPIDASRTRVIFRLVETVPGNYDDPGDEDTFEPTTNEAILTAGDVIAYSVNENTFTGDWHGRTPDVTDLTNPYPGEVVEVTIVDVPSGTVVYRTEVTIQG